MLQYLTLQYSINLENYFILSWGLFIFFPVLYMKNTEVWQVNIKLFFSNFQTCLDPQDLNIKANLQRNRAFIMIFNHQLSLSFCWICLSKVTYFSIAFPLIWVACQIYLPLTELVESFFCIALVLVALSFIWRRGSMALIYWAW